MTDRRGPGIIGRSAATVPGVTTSVNLDLVPTLLPWSAADPACHPFRWDEQEEAELTALIAEMTAAFDTDHGERYLLVGQITEALAARYGRWSCGWHWEARNGGAVTNWCCPRDSIGSPEETADRVVTCLLEWREWVEDLAERFQRLAPPADADPEDRAWHLERAATRLVTLVVDHTSAYSAWRGLCHQVLEWFLASVGLDHEEAEQAITAAIGGRFKSWVVPTLADVNTVGEELAVHLTGEQPYRGDWDHLDR